MTTRRTRVVVGVAGTTAGWAALRAAVAAAEQRDAILYAVRVLPAATAGRAMAPALLRDDLVTAAVEEISDAFGRACGGPPRSVPMRITTVDGPVGPALVQLADREDDLLVLGARCRRRSFGHQPGRYCIRHAGCQVLVVPAPEMARSCSARGLVRDLDQLLQSDGGTRSR